MSATFNTEVSMSMKATPERIWKALTDPAEVKAWLFGTELNTTWKEGSPITYKGVWEGKSYEDKGTVLKIIPNRLIVSTYWSGMSGKPDLPENYMKVSYEIHPEAGGNCTLSIRQENAASQKEADHSKGNWEMVLKGLKELVEKKP
jgi:uncharacterized protein YndB with AHSA1/START domain